VRTAQKYLVISRLVRKYPITQMCKFFDVSRSGYYKWCSRDISQDKDKPVGELIRQCQEETNQTYGYRRIKQWLLRETGLIINHKAVLRVITSIIYWPKSADHAHYIRGIISLKDMRTG